MGSMERQDENIEQDCRVDILRVDEGMDDNGGVVERNVMWSEESQLPPHTKKDDSGSEDDVEAKRSKKNWLEHEEATQPLLPLESRNGAGISPYSEPKQRLASLDVFRGLTIGAMILVDYAGGFWSGINHSPWNGVTFADFVVPAFLFIVGVSLAITFKKITAKRIAVYKVILRALKLFGLGLILQGGYFHGLNDLTYGVDLQLVRIMGVLQRIALAYLIVAICEIFIPKSEIPDTTESFKGLFLIYYWHWVVAFVLTSLYVGLLYGLHVPDWQFEAPAPTGSLDSNISSSSELSLLTVKCNVRGEYSPGCNAVGYVDRSIMGISHLYRHPGYRRTKECSVDSPYDGPLPANAPTWCLAPFDPEGLLSSLMAVVTCFIGAHYGHVWLHMKGHKRQLWQWGTSGFALLVVGILLDLLGMPSNKNLYTLSYTCVTSGAVALFFIAIYVLVDVYERRKMTSLFKFVGTHSLMIYALFACGILPIALQGFYWKSPKDNLIKCILKALGV